MSWLVQPRLVNEPYSDPGVILDFRFGRRAILFDLGEASGLSSRELMRVSHAFVSHTHMDHFAGFDRLLRLCLNRPGTLDLAGPVGFLDQVKARLRSYSWNLLGPASVDFRLQVTEVGCDGLLHRALFPARRAFAREDLGSAAPAGNCLLEEADFRIAFATLDHGLPCLAFALVERMRVNVIPEEIRRRGWPVGPWLGRAKAATRAGAPDETVVEITDRITVRLGELRGSALRTGPGQRVAYVTDARFTPENVGKILALAHEADQLFIEAVFLEEDRATAASRHHLTAAQAGGIAAGARARHATPFHHSPRYLDRPSALGQEFRAAFERP